MFVLQDKDSMPLPSRDKNIKGFGMLHYFSLATVHYTIFFSCILSLYV
jgi:hypothetical protein